MGKRFFFVCLIILLLCCPSIVFNVGSDPPPEFVEPFIFYSTPSGAFGNGNLKVVNFSLLDSFFTFEKLFNGEVSDYELEIEFKDFNNNSNLRKYKYKIKTEDAGVYGLNIVFNPFFDDYYFDENSYSFVVNYNGGDIVYNFTDVVLSFDGGIYYYIFDGVFHLELSKWLDPNVEFEIDPVFGDNTILGSSESIENSIRGIGSVSPESDGTATDISVYLINDDGSDAYNDDVLCALYFYDNLTYIMDTECRQIYLGANNVNNNWYIFNLTSTVNVYSSEKYIIVAWADANVGGCKVANSGSGTKRMIRDSEFHDGCPETFPNPITLDENLSGNVSIYCNYTTSEGSPDWWDNTTYFSSESPSNGSWENSNSFDFNITMEKLNGTFNWTLQASTGDQSSGNYSTNGSKVLNVTSSCGQNVTIWANASANNASNTTNEWFFINTVNCTPSDWWDNTTYFSGEQPVNGSWENSNSFDFNITMEKLNGTFNWTLQASTGDQSSGNYSTNGSKVLNVTSSCGQNVTIWANASANNASNTTNEWFFVNTVNCTPWSNTCPSSSNPSPSNGSGSEPIGTSFFNVTISDVDGNNTWGNMSCDETGDTDSWSNQPNGTRNLSLTTPLDYATTYKCWVNYSDDECSVSDWFTFTTEANQPVNFSNENPANNSFNNGINLTWNITMSDDNGDTFNWTIECSNGNNSNANGASNGSKTCSIAWLDWFSTYYVWVNATDGNLSTNESFVFTTMNETVGNITISNVFPGNGSFNAPLQPYLYVTVNHSINETMNLSWYYGLSKGSESTFLGNDTNIGNSTQSELFLAATNRSTTYYTRVMVNDGEGICINETFSFRTVGYAGAGGYVIHPGANVMGYLGIFGIIGIIVFLLLKKKKKEDESEEY